MRIHSSLNQLMRLPRLLGVGIETWQAYRAKLFPDITMNHIDEGTSPLPAYGDTGGT